MEQIKIKLIYLLQNAYSGERAAAYAYHGHSAAMTDAQEKEDLNKIENEEWEHRQSLGRMLSELGAGPRPRREALMSIVGKIISFLCRCGGYLNVFNFGWFMSMYGAGNLERGNIVEYEVAAQYARECGYEHFVDPLLTMAEIEWDHELYFRKKSLESRWSNYIKIWALPPPRTAIREKFVERQSGLAKV